MPDDSIKIQNDESVKTGQYVTNYRELSTTTDSSPTTTNKYYLQTADEKFWSSNKLPTSIISEKYWQQEGQIPTATDHSQQNTNKYHLPTTDQKFASVQRTSEIMNK